MNFKNIIKKILPISQIKTWAFRTPFLKSKLYSKNRKLFKKKYGLEIGGPSQIFSTDGIFSIYKDVSKMDNCNFSSNNFWSDIQDGSPFTFNRKKKPGHQIILDGTDLSKIPTEKYDLICSSHVIEHIANPIKALYEWKRVLKKNGSFIIIVPNHLKTYDRKRPVTLISHLIKDYDNNVNEDDNTHLEEIINLHDLSIDSTVSSFEEHKARTLDNANRRIAHHHVFDRELLHALLQHIGLSEIQIEERNPFHIIALAKKNKPSNE
jgi:SAM-dependent methyltransferase